MKRTFALTSALIAVGSLAAGSALASEFNYGDQDGYEIMAEIVGISPDGSMYSLSNGTMVRDDAADYVIVGDLQVGDRVELRIDETNALEAVVPAS